MASENPMAGNRYRFCVFLLNRGGCWKMERRQVRRARRLNHCLDFVNGLEVVGITESPSALMYFVICRTEWEDEVMMEVGR